MDEQPNIRPTQIPRQIPAARPRSRRWTGSSLKRDQLEHDHGHRDALSPLAHCETLGVETKPTFRGFVRALWPLVSNQAGAS